MGERTCSDPEFMKTFQELGPADAARALGVSIRSVLARRRRLEAAYGIILQPPGVRSAHADAYPKRVPYEIETGVILIGSDAHYWPGDATTAHRGFVKIIEELAPKLVILNGDVHDGASTSRHDRIGWDKPPTLREELDAVEERVTEIEDAAKKAKRLWTLGNHDMRFENKLANQAPQFQDVRGFSLREQFPRWDFALSMWINKDIVVKHRFKGGIHATHNNTLWSGKTMVTGHLHSLKVTPFDDYNGTRYGVDTGTLAEPHGPHADYVEDNPLNHRSGFAVLTFHKGRLLMPELCAVVDKDHVQFRGQLIKV